MPVELLLIPCGILIITLVLVVVAWWGLGKLLKPGLLRLLLRLGITTALIVGVFLGLPQLIPAPTNDAAGGAGDMRSALAQDVTPLETLVVQAQPLDVGITATGRLEAENVELNFDTEATVTEILVNEGQLVAAGDVLARLDPTDAESSLRQAEITLAAAYASLDELIAPARDIDIAVAEAAVNTARASLNAAYATAPDAYDVEIARIESELALNQLWQTQLNRDLTLQTNPEFRGDNAQAEEVELNTNVQLAERDSQVEDANYANLQNEGANLSSVGSANAQLIQAQAELDDLNAEPTEREIQLAEIGINDALYELDRAETQRRETELIAPFDGVIAIVDLEIGALPPLDAAITLVNTSSFTVDLQLDETDIVGVQVGQPVTFEVAALDREIEGVISKIEIAPTIEGSLVTYIAETIIDSPASDLRIGMTVTATVITEEIADAIVIPNQFIRIDSMTQQNVVTVEVEPGVYEDRPIELGTRNNQESQIISGIRAGETIVVLPQESEEAGGGLFPPPGGGGGPGGGQ